MSASTPAQAPGQRSSTLLRHWSVYLILLAAAAATAPLIVWGQSCGHDFDFHLVSWFDALASWRQGIVYPHWTPSPNFGAGEPRFIFYPPLIWMLGAALGAIADWRFVPVILTFVLLAATGWGTRTLARQAMPKGAATLAGCLAICSGYALFTTYERSAYAELAGGLWIPLMLFLVLREKAKRTALSDRPSLLRKACDGSAALLALVVAAAWLSNAPVGVMASYLLAAFALVIALLSRSWAPVLRAAIGAVLGLGLAAFYLVPAAVEQRWIDIRQATDDPGLLVQNSFLFGKHANPLLELHDTELLKVSWIAVIMIAAAFAGILVSWIRKSLPGKHRWWIPLALTPLAILLLQLPLSLPVWNALPKLRFLQFPWRWLAALEAPMAIFVAAAACQSTRKRRGLVAAGACLIFAAAPVTCGVLFHQNCDSEDAVAGMVQSYRSGAGFEGTDEYAPRGADNTLVASNLPDACLVQDPTIELGKGQPGTTPEWLAGSCEATFPFTANAKGPAPEHKAVRAVTPHAGYLVLRLRRYPAWDVRVNGQPIRNAPMREDGLIAVPVPAGAADVTVDWTTTRDVQWGWWISGAALALVAGLGALERRWTQPRL